jgi:hypothetical protein
LAQSATPTPTSSPSTSPEQQRTAALQEYRDVLDKERALLQDQAKEYYSRVENFAYISLAILVAALSAIIWFFKWMFGQTRTEVVNQLKSELHGSVAVARTELEQFKTEKIESLNSEYLRLKEHLESINSFGKQEVVWLLRDDMSKPVGEIAALSSVGLTRVTTSAPKIDSSDEISDALKKADLAIITFDGTPETKTLLRHASKALKFRQPPISLLIYTYGYYLNDKPVYLDPSDLEHLKDLSSFAPANFPATLVSQAQSLILRNQSAL